MTEAGATIPYPVALERDVRPGSLVRARLRHDALVLWRGDDDRIRVWEDRCPHRSTRLSAGRNLGDCVEGVYHGWRFGKDGSVLAVPAEGNAPRPDIRVKICGSAVSDGLVWATTEAAENVAPRLPAQKGEILIRPLPIRVAAAAVASLLAALAGMRLVATPTGDKSCTVFGYATPLPYENGVETARRCNWRLDEVRRTIENGGAA